MSDFQCKFYLLDGAETLECKDGNAEYVAKIADRPFPDSLLSFVYYDINSWEPRFHEADRALMVSSLVIFSLPFRLLLTFCAT